MNDDISKSFTDDYNELNHFLNSMTENLTLVKYHLAHIVIPLNNEKEMCQSVVELDQIKNNCISLLSSMFTKGISVMQQSNEELRHVNEELKEVNKELKRVKEEVNEELERVNDTMYENQDNLQTTIKEMNDEFQLRLQKINELVGPSITSRSINDRAKYIIEHCLNSDGKSIKGGRITLQNVAAILEYNEKMFGHK